MWALFWFFNTSPSFLKRISVSAQHDAINAGKKIRKISILALRICSALGAMLRQYVIAADYTLHQYFWC
jgi:hypothetical protein